MNIDPLAEDYFDWSPYTYVANNPVLYKDPDGQRIYIYYTDEDGNIMEHEYVFGGTYEGNNQFVKDFYDSMNYILENDADATGVIERLSGDELGNISIFNNIKNNNPYKKNPNLQTYFTDEGTNTMGEREIIWDSRKGDKWNISSGRGTLFTTGSFVEEGYISLALALLHELGHAESSLRDSSQQEKDHNTPVGGEYKNKEEYNVITKIEQPAAEKLEQESIRKCHCGSFYTTVSPTSIKPLNDD